MITAKLNYCRLQDNYWQSLRCHSRGVTLPASADVLPQSYNSPPFLLLSTFPPTYYKPPSFLPLPHILTCSFTPPSLPPSFLLPPPPPSFHQVAVFREYLQELHVASDRDELFLLVLRGVDEAILKVSPGRQSSILASSLGRYSSAYSLSVLGNILAWPSILEIVTLRLKPQE